MEETESDFACEHPDLGRRDAFAAEPLFSRSRFVEWREKQRVAEEFGEVEVEVGYRLDLELGLVVER